MRRKKKQTHNLALHLRLYAMPFLLVHRQVQVAWLGQLLELSSCEACQQRLLLTVQGKQPLKRRVCLLMRMLATMLPAASRPALQQLLDRA